MYEKVHEISKIFPNGVFCKEKFGDCKVLSTKALLNADFDTYELHFVCSFNTHRLHFAQFLLLCFIEISCNFCVINATFLCVHAA